MPVDVSFAPHLQLDGVEHIALQLGGTLWPAGRGSKNHFDPCLSESALARSVRQDAATMIDPQNAHTASSPQGSSPAEADAALHTILPEPDPYFLDVGAFGPARTSGSC